MGNPNPKMDHIKLACKCGSLNSYFQLATKGENAKGKKGPKKLGNF